MLRKDRKSAALRPTRIAIAVGAAFLSSQTVWADPAANQLPSGGSVAAGAVSISSSGTKLQIDQSSDKAILNWQNFSIGRDGWVNFSQPSASSVALNRSMQPAEIFGRLSANGQIFLTSQAGVYFARSAQVDVGGLFATNLSIRDQDFLAGRYVFFNEGSSGSVVNDGTIIVPSGYAALAGTQVQNNGVIVAQAGTVALAAGDRVTLDMVGDGLIKVSVDAAALNALALNAGTLQADGGRVVLTARSANALLDTVINNTGVIRARSLVERNGEIVLDGGSTGVVANSGSIEAAGTTGTAGGNVQVTGQHVTLTQGSSIDASGDTGGGTVIVKASDAAVVQGDVSVRDTGGNGRGGTVETSGHYVEVTRAPDIGPGGTWLIDPFDIEVVADVAPPPPGDTSQIAATMISDQLNGGANVVLDTGGLGSPGAAAGDIRVLAAIDKTVANPASLALKAFHDVQIDEPISIASAFGPTGFGTLTIDAGNNVVVSAPITTQGGGLNIRASGFTNQSAINNGVGGDLKPGMAIFADQFDLAGGTINGGQGSVGLFTRTATNTLGVESAGDTTISNADIASITTSPDLPSTNANQLLIGVGSLGTMRIGDNAQVDGGSKNLVFSGGFGPGTRITVGANGVTTTGDVVLDGSGGSIAGGGTVGGNHVVLRASSGIGTSGARVTTAANTLAVNTGGNAFVSETDNVTLDNIAMMGQTFTNGVSGSLDFAANGSVNVAGSVFAAGGMNVNVAQDLNVIASPGRTALLGTNGNQTVAATNISLEAASSGSNGRAFITNTGGTGDQMITVSGGVLTLTGGADGLANQAGILSNGNQTINGNPQITITGGAGGTGSIATQTHNSAAIQTNGSGKTQTINAAAITVKGGAGNDAFAGIIGANQAIVVSGDVQLTGGAGTGAPIVRIGGVSGAAPGATNLFLSARDVILTGGDSATGEAGLGSTPIGTSPQPNTINVTATRDVILDARNGGTRIGTSQSWATPATGDISINAGRNIELKGGPSTAVIRTAGNVTLHADRAGGTISETGNGFVQAGTLSTTSSGSTSLVGQNQVSMFNGTTWGTDLTLNNSGALTVANLSAGNATLTNAGNVILGGPWSTSGASSISIASDLTVNNNVQSSGPMTLDVNGAVRVVGSGVQDVSLASFGGQTINARSMEVTSLDGRFVSVRNTGPSAQTINLANGAGLDVQTLSGGGFAQVSADGGGNQTIRVADGDHVNVNGWRGNAWIVNPGGIQTLSLTGSGANAITIGSAGALGFSQIRGGNQSISAGQIGESGSIGMTGADANGTFTGIASDQRVGGTQTVSTSGTLRITGGNAPNQPPAGFATGLFHNGSGEQRVSAANIEMQGGASGVNNAVIIIASPLAGTIVPGNQIIEASGGIALRGGSGTSNGAGIFQNRTGSQGITASNLLLQGGSDGSRNGVFINATFGGDQEFNVGGTISVTAGAGGFANSAGIITNGNQAINGNAEITITGGGGTGSIATNTHNSAGIQTNGVGRTQTVNAAAITIKGGAGNDAFAGMTGANQTILVSGDVQLTGGAGTGTPIARIGGSGGAAPFATNLFLSARDVILTGGDSATGEAGLGSTPVGTSPQPNTVNVTATRDVILDGRSGGARIGTSQNLATPATGDISVAAGRDIQLKGGAASAAIRTAGNVNLNAGGSISENQFNAVVAATSLATNSGGNTGLVAQNQVSSFSGSSGGDLSLTNAGDVTINGNTTSTGAMNLDVAGKLTVSAGGMQDAMVHSFGGQTVTARAVEVSARDGRSASLWNTGPSSQSIAASNGAGVDVLVPSGGGFAQILADAGSSQSITVVDGDHINVDGATGSASIIAFSTPQTLSITGSGANAITMGSSGAGSSFAHGSLHQSVTAGNPGESGSITIVGPGVVGGLAGLYDNPSLGGTQTISTSGTISITGGSAPSQLPNFFTGIAHNGSGQQTITAAGITLTGGQSGNGNGATIGAFGGGVAANAGAQVIDVGGGNITVAGGTGGNANTAIINALRDQTILAGGTISVSGGTVGVGDRAGIVAGGNQTIDGGADIAVTGGSSGGAAGNGNNAFISTNGGVGTQQTVHAASLNLLSGTGGIDNSASMGARKQVITVDGDVNLTGRASAGTLGGVRLGGIGGAVFTDTDLTLILNNGGNLTVTGGSVPGNLASIGSGVGTGPLNNTISIYAGGNVVLNPGSTSARIGNSASAPDSGGDIFINAAGIQLNGTGSTPTLIRTTGNVTLSAGGLAGMSEGSNGYVQAGSLSTTSMGPIDFAGPNRVGRLSVLTYGGDLTFNNIGNLELAQVATTGNLLAPGNASITNDGDVSVTGFVTTSGSLTLDVDAGSLDVQPASPFGAVQVSSSGSQSITVTNGDHINVNGGSIFSAGDQSLSITGSGANRITVGAVGTPFGSAIVAGRNQTVTAGSDDQNGSITITGPGTSNTGISGFVTVSGVGAETQTISTTGTLRVTGGTAPVQVPNINSGIFHNRQGQQTITAADIIVEGGASGSNNGAFISTNGPNPGGPGGGDQVINASRSIQVLGSETGTTNRALITSNRNQTINGNADIVVHAGASEVNTTTNAAIAVNAPGMLQTINAHNIALSNAASGGLESFAGIIGSNQVINATGNVTLTGGASGGTLAGARIGSAGGAVLLPTNLTMHIDGDLVLTGGAANNGVALGSSALSSQANNITITTGGSVILNEGSGAGARIGGALADPGGGNISITAGRNIELKGVTQRTAIRTNDNVVLSAGGSITEGANGFIAARELTSTSGGSQSLVGPNQVSRFTAEAASGDVSLRNTAPVLTLGTMDLAGSLTIDQAGALDVPGTVTALNQSIQATGDVTVGGPSSGLAGLFAAGAISIATPGAAVLRGSDEVAGGASAVAAGGLVTLDAGEVQLVGGAAPLAAATVLGGGVTTASAHDYGLTSGSGWGANALLFSASDISMTVGGILTIDGGYTPGNWARIQTATREGTITLNFPSLASGGFFVDGFEGKIKHGQDGFFTGVNKPAKLGDTLLLIYGQ